MATLVAMRAFHHTLAGRLVLFGVVPAFLLMAGVLAWNAVDRFERMEARAEDELLRAPAIEDFQPAAEFGPGDAIPVEPGRGWLLVAAGK